MALVLFTDSYAELAEVDRALYYAPAWSILSTAEKEERIKSASEQIDDLMFHGTKKDTNQPLKFPRFFGNLENLDFFDTGDDIFSEDSQTRKLRRAVIAQCQFDLNREANAAVQVSIGNESFTPRQDILCREARFYLSEYIK